MRRYVRFRGSATGMISFIIAVLMSVGFRTLAVAGCHDCYQKPRMGPSQPQDANCCMDARTCPQCLFACPDTGYQLYIVDMSYCGLLFGEDGGVSCDHSVAKCDPGYPGGGSGGGGGGGGFRDPFNQDEGGCNPIPVCPAWCANCGGL